MTVSTLSPFAVSLPQPTLLYLPQQGVPIRVVETPSDYVTPSIQIATTVLAAAIGVAAIVYQMRRQHRETVEQHARGVKSDLQLDAYRDFQSVFRAYADTGAPWVDAMSIRTELAIAATRPPNSGQPFSITYRTPVFMASLNSHVTAAIGLVFFLERYEALLVGFDVFKTAIGSALHDVHQAVLPFQATLARWLPIDNPELASNPSVPPFIYRPQVTENALSEFDADGASLQVALGRLQCWALDLSVEVQNHLLGKYADQAVKRRSAPDQTYFTVTADPDDRMRLDDLFSATEFVKQNKIAEDNARQIKPVASASSKSGV